MRTKILLIILLSVSGMVRSQQLEHIKGQIRVDQHFKDSCLIRDRYGNRHTITDECALLLLADVNQHFYLKDAPNYTHKDIEKISASQQLMFNAFPLSYKKDEAVLLKMKMPIVVTGGGGDGLECCNPDTHDLIIEDANHKMYFITLRIIEHLKQMHPELTFNWLDTMNIDLHLNKTSYFSIPSPITTDTIFLSNGYTGRDMKYRFIINHQHYWEAARAAQMMMIPYNGLNDNAKKELAEKRKYVIEMKYIADGKTLNYSN